MTSASSLLNNVCFMRGAVMAVAAPVLGGTYRGVKARDARL